MPAKLETIRRFYSGNVIHFPHLNINQGSYHITPGYYGKPFLPSFTISPSVAIANTEFPSFIAPSAMDLPRNRKEELAGFRARICDNCSEVIIEAKYEVEESGKDPVIKTKNEHTCTGLPKTLRAEEMVRLILNLSANLTRLPSELKKAVKVWTGQETFLIAFKQPSDIVKTEDIADIFVSPRGTNYNRNGDEHPNPHFEEILNGWALRVRESGSVALSDNDLVDFIMIANNKTWGYFRIHLDVLKAKDISNSDSEIYCMFINKRPLPIPAGQQTLPFPSEQLQGAT
jgi:hypothetical protein